MHFSWWKIVCAIFSAPWTLRIALMAGRGSFCLCAEGWCFYLPGWFGADCVSLPSTIDNDQLFEVLALANVSNWWLWWEAGSSLDCCVRRHQERVSDWSCLYWQIQKKMLHMNSRHHRKRSVCEGCLYGKERNGDPKGKRPEEYDKWKKKARK